jgi:hypothetical protein
MSSAKPFLAAVFTHIDAEETGEFVCVSATSELHVYLQAGRIAWATNSAHPLAFSRHLLAHTSLRKDVFAEVLESCRRDRLPLGETLLARNLLSLEEIRAALHHQIVDALSSLAESTQERTIFLDRKRQFASYDRRLTFDALELVERPPPRCSASRSRSASARSGAACART